MVWGLASMHESDQLLKYQFSELGCTHGPSPYYREQRVDSHCKCNGFGALKDLVRG